MGAPIRYGIVIATIMVLAAIVLWRSPRATSAVPAQASAQHLQATPRGPAPVASISTASTGNSAVVGFDGFPADSAFDPRRRFEFARNCAKFRHFDAFYKAQAASDPDWPLNNPKALAAMDADQRARLVDNVRFLVNHRQSCEPWLASVSQDLANAQIYRATLEAALQGNRQAAACFIMAPWQTPDERSPYYADLLQHYASSVGRLVQDGLNTGNWAVVLAAYQASLEQHGLRTQANVSDQHAYVIIRLIQRGASDNVERTHLADEAARRSRHLTASEVIALDAQVSALLEDRFKERSVSMQAVTDMCAN
ncbi:hypothetical protein JWH11_07900 [Xanthomonas melonis]|uniref:Uncharacterized protein n=1 Tax=Xanthomonas melonis TaxID=56456 RepID=A0ABS8NTH4_9XANT|nr:hypothetical protein [Xanthomonas melonis]MCD0258148.1 hypothetical protein [Xanthomonas melonis]MCD0266368.1 hypothetical protein [Xanthomonas melonis]